MINLVMILAIGLLSFGINLDKLPLILSESIIMMSNLMIPLVLLFIGIGSGSSHPSVIQKIRSGSVQFVGGSDRSLIG